MMRVVAQDLWMTLTEHLFDILPRHAAGISVRGPALCPSRHPVVTPESVLRGHVHVVAQRLPHVLRRHTVGDGLQGRSPVAERTEHVVTRERPGIRPARTLSSI